MKAHKKPKVHSVAAMESLVQMWLKQAANSTEILNKTNDAHEFFSHYNLLLNALVHLAECEKVLNCFVGELPSKTLARAIGERGRQTLCFIHRFAQDTMSNVNNLPTKKAKMKKIESFFKSLKGYSNHIDNETAVLINDQYETMLNNIR